MSLVDTPQIWACFGTTRVDTKFDQQLGMSPGVRGVCDFHFYWLCVAGNGLTLSDRYRYECVHLQGSAAA